MISSGLEEGLRGCRAGAPCSKFVGIVVVEKECEAKKYKWLGEVNRKV